ncbi:hypothetical protein OESDEN_20439 [Oesophagostomum dentatum]|uniref:YitH/HolE acetyltransferase (GNAT) domain-containing protein n=1 Tax=Oesophagostomum dentatum TaxID=61180 RepID=A0A0B1S9I8_OESDE|nr:hypothetical protein OESDEN_20439 [Oesophagostomum dentatum]
MEIGKGSNMVLLGVLEMSQKYATKYGFNKMPKYVYILANIPIEHLVIPDADPRYILKDFKDIELAKLLAYDASISHRNRGKFLYNFITKCKCYCKVALDPSGEIVGYCNIRVAYANFLAVSPLYADNEAIAQTLFAGVLSMIKDIKKYRFIEIHYPEFNKEAQRLCEFVGGGHTHAQPYLQCAFTKKVLPVDEAKVFGIVDGTNTFV